MKLPEYIKTEEDYVQFIENFKWFDFAKLHSNNQPLINNCNFILQELANDAFSNGIISNNISYTMQRENGYSFNLIRPIEKIRIDLSFSKG